ncbi:MAG: hypothetical protein NZ570_04170 [Candidatus Caldarchaeum sp.]|nr:hypothetical protein [Candidatus Caldarchaeum sp.]MDW7978087.1 hypothetical protein [Candidatus Caldarchaeum sp.]MDW8360553.1 hypothetical protein [Candidatus Caldarchaeum sp.]
MVVSHELSPKERPEVLELHRGLRDVVKALRNFLDTEDYGFLRKAVEAHERLKTHKQYPSLSGRLDLENNLKAMDEISRSHSDKMDDLVHGRLLDQVVYTIVRANIITTGLEFKLKRMRKG